MSISTHHDYMSSALQLAERGRYTVSPNPMVGCIIVKNGSIIGQGYHQRAGEAHAEIYALREAGEQARDATVYVTLEPCCHTGRTPPCTRALIQAGIKKVVIACQDPNPLIAGKGMQALQAAGIEIEMGVCEDSAKNLNEIFFHFIKNRRPFVIAKWAMSLDGKTITHPHDTRDISSAAAHEHAHDIRQQVDAILIGSSTAIHDDPLLTVRIPDVQNAKQPIRIILSSQGLLPQHLQILNTPQLAKTIIATTMNMDNTLLEKFTSRHIDVIRLAANHQGQVYLPALLEELGKRDITSLLIEGGNRIHESFIRDKLVNKIHVYLAPVIIGALEKKQVMNNFQISSIDRDLFISADYSGATHV